MAESLPLPLDTGSGYLVVQVSTASAAIPLEGATVSIRAEGDGASEILYVLKTGADGRTARVTLAAPPRQSSLQAGNARPYAPYHIEVVLEGFERAEYANVPIFDGITAVQQADLAPLPQAGYTDGFSKNAPEITVSENGARL